VKRYTFNVDATSVSGSQTYYVDAESEQEAREIVEGGGGEFVCEELEVQDLGTFELDHVEDIPASHIVEPTEKVADVAPVAWISVSERLPDFDVPVAVAWDKAPWRTDSVSAVDDMLHARNKDSDGWLWYTVSTGDLDEWDAADMPTHWMQLPPAPAAPA
jgi:hypothetical protein